MFCIMYTYFNNKKKYFNTHTVVFFGTIFQYFNKRLHFFLYLIKIRCLNVCKKKLKALITSYKVKYFIVIIFRRNI